MSQIPPTFPSTIGNEIENPRLDSSNSLFLPPNSTLAIVVPTNKDLISLSPPPVLPPSPTLPSASPSFILSINDTTTSANNTIMPQQITSNTVQSIAKSRLFNDTDFKNYRALTIDERAKLIADPVTGTKYSAMASRLVFLNTIARQKRKMSTPPNESSHPPSLSSPFTHSSGSLIKTRSSLKRTKETTNSQSSQSSHNNHTIISEPIRSSRSLLLKKNITNSNINKNKNINKSPIIPSPTSSLPCVNLPPPINNISNTTLISPPPISPFNNPPTPMNTNPNRPDLCPYCKAKFYNKQVYPRCYDCTVKVKANKICQDDIIKSITTTNLTIQNLTPFPSLTNNINSTTNKTKPIFIAPIPLTSNYKCNLPNVDPFITTSNNPHTTVYHNPTFTPPTNRKLQVDTPSTNNIDISLPDTLITPLNDINITDVTVINTTNPTLTTTILIPLTTHITDINNTTNTLNTPYKPITTDMNWLTPPTNLSSHTQTPLSNNIDINNPTNLTITNTPTSECYMFNLLNIIDVNIDLETLGNNFYDVINFKGTNITTPIDMKVFNLSMLIDKISYTEKEIHDKIDNILEHNFYTTKLLMTECLSSLQNILTILKMYNPKIHTLFKRLTLPIAVSDINTENYDNITNILIESNTLVFTQLKIGSLNRFNNNIIKLHNHLALISQDFNITIINKIKEHWFIIINDILLRFLNFRFACHLHNNIRKNNSNKNSKTISKVKAIVYDLNKKPATINQIDLTDNTDTYMKTKAITYDINKKPVTIDHVDLTVNIDTRTSAINTPLTTPNTNNTITLTTPTIKNITLTSKPNIIKKRIIVTAPSIGPITIKPITTQSAPLLKNPPTYTNPTLPSTNKRINQTYPTTTIKKSKTNHENNNSEPHINRDHNNIPRDNFNSIPIPTMTHNNINNIIPNNNNPNISNRFINNNNEPPRNRDQNYYKNPHHPPNHPYNNNNNYNNHTPNPNYYPNNNNYTHHNNTNYNNNPPLPNNDHYYPNHNNDHYTNYNNNTSSNNNQHQYINSLPNTNYDGNNNPLYPNNNYTNYNNNNYTTDNNVPPPNTHMDYNNYNNNNINYNTNNPPNFRHSTPPHIVEYNNDDEYLDPNPPNNSRLNTTNELPNNIHDYNTKYRNY